MVTKLGPFCFLSFLCMGVMFAIFHDFATFPVAKEKLYMRASMPDIEFACIFKHHWADFVWTTCLICVESV